MGRKGVKESISTPGTPAYGVMYDLVHTNLSKKEIANKNGVPLDVVYTILKKHKREIELEKSKQVENMIDKMTAEREAKNKQEDTSVSTAEPMKVTEEILEEEEHYQVEGKHGLTENDILKIIELTEKKYTKRRIARIMGISYNTVIKYQKEFDLYEPTVSYTVDVATRKKGTVTTAPVQEITKQEVTANEENKQESNNSPIVTVISPGDDILEAGMIKDRHIIPCNTFIFESIKDYELFDFEKMEYAVSEFLESNIKLTENDKGELVGSKTLHLYVTGLTSALASVIKVCHEKKINLTLLHYNHSNNCYKTQVIWNEFIKENEAKKIFKVNGNITLFDCSLDSIKDNNFYLITIVNFKSKQSQKTTDVIVFDDYSLVWPYYGDLIGETMKDTKNKIGLFADLCSVVNGELNYIRRLGASSNFDFDYKRI